MSYHVHEIFRTVQGEGLHTGRPAVFVRFNSCNLWTGREADRHTAICQFCDTTFTGYDTDSAGANYPNAVALADAIYRIGGDITFLVFTGGEPALHVDDDLVHELHNRGYYLAIETNGTLPVVKHLDWVCVSPKAGTMLRQQWGDELKVVYPQPDLNFYHLPMQNFSHLWLSPMDGPHLRQNIDAALDYCLRHPKWRLNIQTHKIIGAR